MDRLALTLYEACEVANVPQSLIYRSLAAGTGPKFRKAGNRTLILKEDLEAWLRTLPISSDTAQLTRMPGS